MDFGVRALDSVKFAHLYGLSDAELGRRGVRRYRVDEQPGFPCRVSLLDAQVGESVLLLNYEHQPADTPYRSSHAIFVREGAETATLGRNEVPELLRIRKLSVRSFDRHGMMLDADLVDGRHLETLVAHLFEHPDAPCLHVHNAGRGCYAASIDRA